MCWATGRCLPQCPHQTLFCYHANRIPKTHKNRNLNAIADFSEAFNPSYAPARREYSSLLQNNHQSTADNQCLFTDCQYCREPEFPPTEKLNYLTFYKKSLDIFANLKYTGVIQVKQS